MTNKSSSTPGDTLTLRDKEALGKFRQRGLLKYRDLEAGYCVGCSTVFNVQCPTCKAESGNHRNSDGNLFKVGRPLETTREEGLIWTIAECAKCDAKFKVIVHN